MVYLSKLPKIKYNSPQYSLDIGLKQETLLITMQLHSLPLSTRNLAKTNRILEKNLPSIFNQCFNDENLCFYDEAKNTEIGHLFEHILLENLVITSQITKKVNKAIMSGRTSWNWEKEPVGRFHIKLNPVEIPRSKLFECLRESINLTDTIINSGKKHSLLN